MPTKKQLAERIATIEQPDQAVEARGFYVETLVEGFSHAELTSKLAVVTGMNLVPPVPAPAHEASHAAQDGVPDGAVVPDTGQPGTAIVPADDGDMSPALRGQLPDEARWAQIERISRFIAKSDLAPPHLRGKPEHVQMILLVANDLGISATQAMQKVSVIEGQPALSAELMVAMVLRDGHRIWPDPGNDRTHATAWGQRREHDGGWGPVMSASFSLDDAKAAGLIDIKEGQAWARSQKGKPLPWELYPGDLLWARAVSRLVRRCFADAGAGVTYVPEELGYLEEAEDPMTARRAAQEEASVTATQQRTEIARRIADLPDDDRARLREEWKRRHLPKPDDLSPAAIRTALNLLEATEQIVADRDAAAGAHIEDADVVDDAERTPEEIVQSMVDQGLVTKGTPTTDLDDDVAEGELVDEPDECACGDGPETPERPFVYSEDGKPYHADDAPFLA